MVFSNLLPDEIIKNYLDMLCLNNWRVFEPFTIIICAHPDDETIGMGSRLKKIKNAIFIYITNGAPSNPYYYSTAGFASNELYVKARKKELFHALALAGFRRKDCIFLDIPDQEAIFNIPYIAKELTDIFKAHEPDTIITHAYEGGHPDHDSTALAVNIALQNNLRQNSYAPIALEYSSYFGNNGEIVTGRFLTMENYLLREVILSEEEKAQKVKMINSFNTQLQFLKLFSMDVESFRQMPDYDFDKPPHYGKLFYEYFDWGVSGQKWREYAMSALEHFRISER